ncbi:MAG: hypothetical protein AAF696_31570 [Bacteroidota bacterium]
MSRPVTVPDTFARGISAKDCTGKMKQAQTKNVVANFNKLILGMSSKLVSEVLPAYAGNYIF